MLLERDQFPPLFLQTVAETCHWQQQDRQLEEPGKEDTGEGATSSNRK